MEKVIVIVINYNQKYVIVMVINYISGKSNCNCYGSEKNVMFKGLLSGKHVVVGASDCSYDA